MWTRICRYYVDFGDGTAAGFGPRGHCLLHKRAVEARHIHQPMVRADVAGSARARFAARPAFRPCLLSSKG
jgi:hypothetical protein